MTNQANARNKMINVAHQATGCSATVLVKAVAKAGRWMKAAYGNVDWVEFANETGYDGLISYVKDTLAHTDGQATVNRMILRKEA